MAQRPSSCSLAAVRAVPDSVRESREHLDRGAIDQGGSRTQQYAARTGVFGLRDSLRLFPAHRRLDRR